MSTLHEDLRRLADSTGSGFPYVSVYSLRGALAAHPEPEGVGTGAGEGAPRQDTGSAIFIRAAGYDAEAPEVQAAITAAKEWFDSRREPDAGDVEALADSIAGCFSNVSDLPEWMRAPALGRYMRPLVEIAARAVLASDWLIAHDAKVRRETAERIAEAIERDRNVSPADNLYTQGYRDGYNDSQESAARLARAEGER